MSVELRLVPLTREHVPAVEPLVRDPDIVYFTRIPDAAPAEFAREWVERYENGVREGTRAGFAVLDGDGELVGMALVPTIDREAQEAEIGYLVAPAARGRGVGTEMLRRLTAWAFEQGIERVYLLIDVDNVASNIVAERAGYAREGVMRNAYLKPGRRGDTVLWSRLPTDPPPGSQADGGATSRS
jgi:RimJ/RimL family protein N-acetyltransferase